MSQATPIPLGMDPYGSAYNSVGREICENLYLESGGSATAKAQAFFIKIPGLRRWFEATGSSACRGKFSASNGRVFGVYGQSVFELYANATRVLRFTLTTYTGPVSMTENGAYLLLVDGAHGWTFKFDDGTVSMIDPNADGDEGFPNGATHAVCIDTYFLVNDPRTNRYNWSNPQYLGRTSAGLAGDGHWNGQNMNKKIAKTDNIVAICDCQNMAWLFGERSIEVHYDAGADATATVGFAGVWKRYESAIIEVGCTTGADGKAFHPARYANNVFWIGSDLSGTMGVFSNEGFAPKRISTRGVEQIMARMPQVGDALGMTFSEQGHAFYLLHFPSGDRTLVYDITTQKWHERTYLYREMGTTHRWRGTFVTAAFGGLLWGDNSTDAVYTSDQLHYVNDNPTGTGVNYIKCVKTSPIGFQNGAYVGYNAVQPIFAQGLGLPQNTSEDVGLDPQCLVAYSDDSGYTYSNEREAAMGKQGNYDERSRIVGTGAARNRVWRITVSEPVPVVLVGLLAELRSFTR